MDPLSVQYTWGTAFDGLFNGFLLHKHFLFSLFFLWSMLHYSFFHLLCFFVFCFSLSLVYAALFFLSSSLLSLVYAALFFFFLPFCLSHLRPIKKKSMIGATNWLLWVCEFSGCFKLRTEVVVVVGIGGWRKKKGMLGLKSLVLGGNGVRGVSQQECLTCCSGMGSTKSRKKIKWWEIENMCQTRYGILSDKRWKKKKSKQGLSFVTRFGTWEY